MKKFFKTWIIFVFLAVVGAALALHLSLKKNPTRIDIYQMVCTPDGSMGYELSGHPYNKYGVWVSCDDGQGTSIGITKTGVGIVWRDPRFSYITSIQWSSDGAELTIYGWRKAYRLDLEHQKVLEEYNNPPSIYGTGSLSGQTLSPGMLGIAQNQRAMFEPGRN